MLHLQFRVSLGSILMLPIFLRRRLACLKTDYGAVLKFTAVIQSNTAQVYQQVALP